MPHKDPEVKKAFHRAYYQKKRAEILRQQREYREANPEKIYERNKRYVSQNIDKHREWVAKANRKWRKAHPEQWAEILAKYDREFPERRAAIRAVQKALRKGQLTRPDHCVFCRRPGKPHAHHDDYAKPLEVVWLCSPCHKLADQKRASREIKS